MSGSITPGTVCWTPSRKWTCRPVTTCSKPTSSARCRPCRRSFRSCGSRAAARSSTSPASPDIFLCRFTRSYSATKFALNAIGKAAGVELKKDGIHVLTVCPGYVRTAFSENAVRGNELKKVRPAAVRGISAERVARATLRGYLKAEAGSHRSVDDARAGEAVSTVSGPGGVGDGQDGEVGRFQSFKVSKVSRCRAALNVRTLKP